MQQRADRLSPGCKEMDTFENLHLFKPRKFALSRTKAEQTFKIFSNHLVTARTRTHTHFLLVKLAYLKKSSETHAGWKTSYWQTAQELVEVLLRKEQCRINTSILGEYQHTTEVASKPEHKQYILNDRVISLHVYPTNGAHANTGMKQHSCHPRYQKYFPLTSLTTILHLQILNC